MAEQCAWCLQEGVPLVNHHYPIPKSEGGIETVRICHNCHWRAHTMFFVDATEAKTPEELEELVDARLEDTVREVFPGLWQQGWVTFPAYQVLALTPPCMWKGLTDEQIAEATEAFADARRHFNQAHGRA